jgi:murein DD-endopeptidase MepM/ murein hydrolase activator NlpD
MHQPDEQFHDSPPYPRGELESPFLNEELFAGEAESEWEPRTAPLFSPFQHIFEYASEPVLEAERHDGDVCREHDDSEAEDFSAWQEGEPPKAAGYEQVFEQFSAGEAPLYNEEGPQAVKAPKPVPGVEFAPAPPQGSFWPVRTTHPRGREVAYQAIDGSFVGNPGRAFKGGREGGARYHVGIDLFARLGDPVVACEAGTVVNFHGFLGKTKALLVEHESGVVVNYGEVAPDSLQRAGLKLNDRVKAGQVIGYIGLLPKGSSMLHFETYRKGTRSSKPWRPGQDRPHEILNPTRYLLFLQERGSGAAAEPADSAVAGSLASLPRRLADAVRQGLMSLQVALSMLAGERDLNRLTNTIFSARHPERAPSQKILPGEKQLAREWLDIRDRMVRPALAALSATPSPRTSPQRSSSPPPPASGGPSPLDVLSPSELKAVRITSTFETGRAGSFGGLTGNFDGQGVSFGLMNFAWKAGSLLTLLKEFLRDHPAAFAEVFGPDAAMFREMVLATKADPKNPKRQVRDLDRQMEFARNVLNDAKNKIREPWRTYFGRLEANREFQRIQVTAVRKAVDRARYWCDYFGLKTERAFAFMFDLVSSHGGAWLNAPKFKERRRNLLRAMLEKKQAQVGRNDLTELETMEVIAHMIGEVSLEKWRDKVRVRKLWFVRGSGDVHEKSRDLARDFGVTDALPDFGTGTGSKELVEELCEEKDPGIPEDGEELFLSEHVAPWEESPPIPEETWVESEEEADYCPVETAYLDDQPAPSEETGHEAEERTEFGELELDASPGKTLYLPVQLSRDIPPEVGVFLPSGFRATAVVDILVYFHGHIIPLCKTDAGEFNKAGMEYYWNTPLFRCLREDLAASGLLAILIAPTFVPIFGSRNTPSSRYGALDQAGKFDFLIEETLAALSQRGELPARAQARNIVLSGHSAGGLPMQTVLAAKNSLGKNIVECWGFECLYFGTSEWTGWLKANPSRYFRHFRRPSPFDSPTKALERHANFVDVNDGTDHCLIVREKWRQAIDGSPALRGGAGASSPPASSGGGAMSALLSLLTGLPGLATLPITFLNALLGGLRDENHLTNLIFHVRHPGLAGRKLTGADPQSLKNERRFPRTEIRQSSY